MREISSFILPDHFCHAVDQIGIGEFERSQIVVLLETRALRFEITIDGATGDSRIA